MAERDEFQTKIKRALALRANYRCSNPQCRRPTCQPDSSPTGVIITGIAAHICAAAPEGPRFDATQSSEERTAISNGIWLCTTCGVVVDRDPINYPRELLVKWRVEHEAWVSSGAMCPSLPRVEIRTLQGLMLPDSGGQIAGEDIALFRQHELTVEPDSPHQLLDFHARVQFHEGYLDHEVLSAPPASGLTVTQDKIELIAFATGGGSVTFPPRTGATAGGFKLSCQRLVRGRPLRVRLRSLPWCDSVISVPFAGRVNDGDPLVHYMEACFHYLDGEQLFERFFCVPLMPQSDRTISAMLPEENFDDRSRERLRW